MNGSTVRGGAGHGGTGQGSTVCGGTGHGSTMRGSTVRGSTVRGSTVRCVAAGATRHSPGAAGQRCPAAWEWRRAPAFPDSSSEEEVWSGHSQDGGDSRPGYTFCGLRRSFLCTEPASARPPQRPLDAKTRLPGGWRQLLTAEEAERNAEELLAEEERVKRKAEKKKLKKKRQKERKKQEKLLGALGSKEEAEAAPSSQDSAAGSRAEEPEGCPEPGAPGRPAEPAGAEELPEDGLDWSCTFVSKARHKAAAKLLAPARHKPAGTADAAGGRPRCKAPEPADASAVERSLVLADSGNEAAHKGLYAEAVQAFTEAMQLNPREHRLFGNRSYCYERLQRYEEALGDARAALALQPGWPKGLFRQGKALRGLKRYDEAVRTFKELLHQDGSHADAAAQLEQCRALLRGLISGPPQQSSGSSPGNVPPLSPPGAAGPSPPLAGERPCGGPCHAARNGFVTVTRSRSPSKGQARAAAAGSPEHTWPPQHPARGCYPLWVGNLSNGVTEQALQGSFSRFGQIRFVRVLPGRHCAFVNFVHKEAAEAAYRSMLDKDMQGTRLALQLKHPSHATPPPGRHKPSVK